jgi:EAL domain-containing protein (putative c-di-GMP-specific phosphodiesterase class I)
MYAAKHAGKNRVRVASDSDLERMRTGLTWSGRLREAVDHGGFELHGQPIIDLASGSVVEWELLLRLPGENAELIPPAQFLATAERSGLSLELDRWVLLRAIDLLAEHHRAGVELNLSVNLCGRSLDDLELPAFIQRSLDERQVDPARLGLEVAETAAIASVGRARAFAAQLSEVGCGFAFDDFGAGFGAFHYLKHLPFDSVKIDGEFIQNLASSSTDQLILDSIVQMCQGLGKRTIAKFVGDQSTVEVLRRHGVDSAQGYHLGRPLPIREAFGDARA